MANSSEDQKRAALDHIKMCGAADAVVFLLRDHLQGLEERVLQGSPDDPQINIRLAEAQSFKSYANFLEGKLKGK